MRRDFDESCVRSEAQLPEGQTDVSQRERRQRPALLGPRSPVECPDLLLIFEVDSSVVQRVKRDSFLLSACNRITVCSQDE